MLLPVVLNMKDFVNVYSSSVKSKFLQLKLFENIEIKNR